MNKDEKISRGEFLAIVGGIVVTAAVIKFSGVQSTLATVDKAKRVIRPARDMYGNGVYGGRRT